MGGADPQEARGLLGACRRRGLRLGGNLLQGPGGGAHALRAALQERETQGVLRRVGRRLGDEVRAGGREGEGREEKGQEASSPHRRGEKSRRCDGRAREEEDGGG